MTPVAVSPKLLYVFHSRAGTLNREHDWRAALGDFFDLLALGCTVDATSKDFVDILASHRDAAIVAFALKLRFVPEPFDLPTPTAPRVLVEPDAFLTFCDQLSGPKNLRGRLERAFNLGRFRCVLTRDAFSAKKLQSVGIPAAWIPHGVDTDVFGQTDLPRTVPVAFVGSTSPSLYTQRLELARFLRARVSGAQVYDESARLDGDDYAILLARTRLFVSTPIDPGGQVDKTEAKLFEAMASGCCVLRRRTEELDRLGFTPGVHYIPFETVGDLPGVLDSCSRSPELVALVAREGRALVRTKHTWWHRARAATAYFTTLQGPGLG